MSRYSFITPRRVAPVVSQNVIDAREGVRQAIARGSVRDIDDAYQRLEAADKIAQARRASAHALRVSERAVRKATAILGSPDPKEPGK